MRFRNRRIITGHLSTGKMCYFFLALLIIGLPYVSAQETVFSPESSDTVKAKTLEWVKQQNPDQKTVESVTKLWETETTQPDELTELTVRTFGLVDPETNQFLEKCVYDRNPYLPDLEFIPNHKKLGEFYQANMGLYYGKFLAQRELYDDALVIFKQTDVKKVIDPASYFFYLGICQHRLFQKKECVETLNLLLENTEQVPDRYRSIAQLMKYELEQIKEKSIGEISHKMGDSRRRLDLGQGGPKTRKVQDEIIALLDELIKKKEEQSSSSSSSSSASGSNQSGDVKPAEESRVKGSTAPGNVDEKRLVKQGGWGGLPPKEQAKAKSMINRQFPSHYREAVEKYFKKLATRKAEPSGNND